MQLWHCFSGWRNKSGFDKCQHLNAGRCLTFGMYLSTVPSSGLRNLKGSFLLRSIMHSSTLLKKSDGDCNSTVPIIHVKKRKGKKGEKVGVFFSYPVYSIHSRVENWQMYHFVCARSELEKGWNGLKFYLLFPSFLPSSFCNLSPRCPHNFRTHTHMTLGGENGERTEKFHLYEDKDRKKQRKDSLTFGSYIFPLNYAIILCKYVKVDAMNTLHHHLHSSPRRKGYTRNARLIGSRIDQFRAIIVRMIRTGSSAADSIVIAAPSRKPRKLHSRYVRRNFGWENTLHLLFEYSLALRKSLFDNT